MPTRKSGVDWKARKTLEAERKAVVALLSKINTYAEMIDYEINLHNFGFASDYTAHIIKAIRDSGYIIERGDNG